MFTALHRHLVVNHLPVVGCVFAAVLLLFALFRRRKPEAGAQDGAVIALSVVVVVGLLSALAYFTGEPAEEFLEGLPGDWSHDFIERHEGAAKWALGLALGAALPALFGLARLAKSKSLPAWSLWASLVLSTAAVGAHAWVASLGGAIRRPELRGTDLALPPKDVERTFPKRDDPTENDDTREFFQHDH